MKAKLDDSALRARLIASVVKHCPVGPRKRYKWLSDITGISDRAWKNLFNLKQHATVEMIVAWCGLVPAATDYVLHGDRTEKRAGASTAPDGVDSERSQHGLLKSAIEKAGGLRALSRQLDWHSGAISEVLAGKVRLPPYRAGQCAALLGGNPDEWIFDSLRRGAKTEGERDYWTSRLNAATRALSRDPQQDYRKDFPARLIENAVKKAGGVRALARELGWNPGSMMKAREKISPYRAAQLAQYLEVNAAPPLMAALAAGSKSDDEAAFWANFHE